jgi:hypothetical protein
MADCTKAFLLGPNGDTLAELLIADEEEGWLTGKAIGTPAAKSR